MTPNQNSVQVSSNTQSKDLFSDPKGKRVSRQQSWCTYKSPSLDSEFSNFSSHPSSMIISRLPPLKSDNEDDCDTESGFQTPPFSPERDPNVEIRESIASSSIGLGFIDASHIHNIQPSYIPEIPRKSSKRASSSNLAYDSFKSYSRTEPFPIVRPGSVSELVQGIESSNTWG